jgi:transposase
LRIKSCRIRRIKWREGVMKSITLWRRYGIGMLQKGREEEREYETKKILMIWRRNAFFSCISTRVFREQPLPKNRLSPDDLDLKVLTVPSSINNIYSRETMIFIFTHFCFKLLILHRYEFFFVRVNENTSLVCPATYARDSCKVISIYATERLMCWV